MILQLMRIQEKLQKGDGSDNQIIQQNPPQIGLVKDSTTKDTISKQLSQSLPLQQQISQEELFHKIEKKNSEEIREIKILEKKQLASEYLENKENEVPDFTCKDVVKKYIIISQDAPLFQAYHAVFFITTLVSSFQYAFSMCFIDRMSKFHVDAFIQFDSVYQIFFAVSIGVRMMTEHVDPISGAVCRDPFAIIMNYLKSTFILDVITVIPLVSMLGDLQNSKLRIILVLKLGRLYYSFTQENRNMILGEIKKWQKQNLQKALMKKESAEDQSKDQTMITFILKIKYALRASNLLWILVCLSYFGGLLWWMFCTLEEQEGVTFITKHEIDPNQSFGDLVVLTSYFMFTSLSTVGLGDFHPTNDAERMAGTIILLFGVLLTSIVTENFLDMINNLKSIGEGFEESDELSLFLATMRRFNGNQALPKEFSLSIESYFQYRWQYNKNQAIDSYDEEALLLQLPIYVQQAIFSEYLFKDFLRVFKAELMPPRIQKEALPMELINLFRSVRLQASKDMKESYKINQQKICWESDRFKRLVVAILKELEPLQLISGQTLLDFGKEAGEVYFVMNCCVHVSYSQNYFSKQLTIEKEGKEKITSAVSQMMNFKSVYYQRSVVRLSPGDLTIGMFELLYDQHSEYKYSAGSLTQAYQQNVSDGQELIQSMFLRRRNWVKILEGARDIGFIVEGYKTRVLFSYLKKVFVPIRKDQNKGIKVKTHYQKEVRKLLNAKRNTNEVKIHKARSDYFKSSAKKKDSSEDLDVMSSKNSVASNTSKSNFCSLFSEEFKYEHPIRMLYHQLKCQKELPALKSEEDEEKEEEKEEDSSSSMSSSGSSISKDEKSSSLFHYQNKADKEKEEWVGLIKKFGHIDKLQRKQDWLMVNILGYYENMVLMNMKLLQIKAKLLEQLQLRETQLKKYKGRSQAWKNLILKYACKECLTKIQSTTEYMECLTEIQSPKMSTYQSGLLKSNDLSDNGELHTSTYSSHNSNNRPSGYESQRTYSQYIRHTPKSDNNPATTSFPQIIGNQPEAHQNKQVFMMSDTLNQEDMKQQDQSSTKSDQAHIAQSDRKQIASNLRIQTDNLSDNSSAMPNHYHNAAAQLPSMSPFNASNTSHFKSASNHTPSPDRLFVQPPPLSININNNDPEQYLSSPLKRNILQGVDGRIEEDIKGEHDTLSAITSNISQLGPGGSKISPSLQQKGLQSIGTNSLKSFQSVSSDPIVSQDGRMNSGFFGIVGGETESEGRRKLLIPENSRRGQRSSLKSVQTQFQKQKSQFKIQSGVSDIDPDAQSGSASSQSGQQISEHISPSVNDNDKGEENIAFQTGSDSEEEAKVSLTAGSQRGGRVSQNLFENLNTSQKKNHRGSESHQKRIKAFMNLEPKSMEYGLIAPMEKEPSTKFLPIHFDRPLEPSPISQNDINIEMVQQQRFEQDPREESKVIDISEKQDETSFPQNDPFAQVLNQSNFPGSSGKKKSENRKKQRSEKRKREELKEERKSEESLLVEDLTQPELPKNSNSSQTNNTDSTIRATKPSPAPSLPPKAQVQSLKSLSKPRIIKRQTKRKRPEPVETTRRPIPQDSSSFKTIVTPNPQSVIHKVDTFQAPSRDESKSNVSGKSGQKEKESSSKSDNNFQLSKAPTGAFGLKNLSSIKVDKALSVRNLKKTSDEEVIETHYDESPKLTMKRPRLAKESVKSVVIYQSDIQEEIHIESE